MAETSYHDARTNLTVREILDRISVASTGMPSGIHYLENEIVLDAGVDPFLVSRTPTDECLRIDINPMNDAPFRPKVFLRALRSLSEIFPGGRDVVAVLEDSSVGSIIFLPAPRQANGL